MSTSSNLTTGTYWTDGLDLASFLVARGHNPEVEPSASGIVRFGFQVSPSFTADFGGYYDGTVTVPPAIYNQTRAKLASQIRRLRGGQR